MTTELKQTKNTFKVIGKATRLEKDGAFKEEQATKGKREGDTYRALRFGVKTSEENEITVEMFDYEPKEVFLWHTEKAKAEKEKGGKYKGLRVPFAEWEEKQEEYREAGHSILQTRIGLEFKDEGKKLDSKGMPSFIASEYIYENLNNGDCVSVEGEIRYSSYEGQDGKMKERKTFKIEKVHRVKELDFTSADYEEVSYFEQQAVFVDAFEEKKEKKTYVIARVIDYAKNFHDTQLVVDYAGENGEDDAGMKKLADALAKKFQFGDLFNAFGETINKVIVDEVEEEVEEDELLASLGGKKKPTHAQSYQSRTYISEMRIEGIDAWDKKEYKEEDFVKDNLVEEDKLQNELGGKSKKQTSNPFEIDNDSNDITEEDLPF